jgi:hypothetical protein
MLIEEAQWIAAAFAAMPDDELFPLINVGSSTYEHRAIDQPHIERDVFRPLAERRGQVVHVDAKAADGVDVVGDLVDPRFVARLRDQLAPRALLVSNLLEHVIDREAVAGSLVLLVRPGGVIVVTGPHRYPYHPDPIDTRFRPSPAEVHALFPGTMVRTQTIIVSRTWRPWRAGPGQGRRAGLYALRLAAPFYRPRSWRRRVDTVPYVVEPVSAYATILVKDSPT